MEQSNNKKPFTLFFIGIGGIGMSALARFFLHYGYKVGGYDRVRSKVSIALEDLGAEIIYQDEPALIPEIYRAPAEVKVIYTPAIHDDNAIRTYYREAGYPQIKRAVLLGEVTRKLSALCVAGTHGKTTTSTILAHLLRSSHIGTNAFLGGISLNFDSNLLLDNESPYVVIEADEFDRSFHQLHPLHAIITSTEPDHLDIYGSEESYKEAFAYFASLLPAEGTLLLYEEATLDLSGVKAQVSMYGTSEASAYRYDNITYRAGRLYFDWYFPNGVYRAMEIGTPIEINILNATAALALAQQLGANEEELRQGLATFRGAKRRFEKLLDEPGKPIMIDDYAHHPDEIRASLDSIHKLYPDKKITVVFQPHLYSRTADFMREFADALSIAGDVILIPIYPAREAPIPGVTSDAIAELITSPNKVVVEKSALVDELKKHHFDLLVMMGAGDIEYELPRVKEYLEGL